MKIVSIIGIILMAVTTLTFGSNSKGNIVVHMDNFRNNKGEVRVSLFSSKEGFPDKPKKAFKTISSKIKNKKSKVTFINIPFGVYAIGILHDENSNLEMDYYWLHIPKEEYGASNNATGRFGPPDFKDAKFELNSTSINVDIKVQ